MGITKEENEAVGVLEAPEKIDTKIEEKVSTIELNPYREQLLAKNPNNPFANTPISYFLKNHTKRLNSFYKNNTVARENIQYIREYLEVLTEVEQDPDVDVSKVYNSSLRHTYNIGRANGILFIKSTYSNGMANRVNMYAYASQRLPHCCGVCEYGAFAFWDYKKIERNLLFNLMLDLIRLTANNERVQHSGAVGIINYFVNTPFMEVLLSRDDLSLLKEFKNPKTSATLNMFTFNTKIK